MKKKSYQKPLMISEKFVPQEYVAACIPDVNWRPKPNATPFASNSHFWIDSNNNTLLDSDEKTKNNRVTCNSSGTLPKNETGFYIFEDDSETRLFAFRINGQSVVAYELD